MDKVKEQFRLVAQLLVGIETVVYSDGPMDQDMVKNMGAWAGLNEQGFKFLADMVNQSEKLVCRKRGEKVWVFPNPKYKEDADGQA